MKEVKTVFVVGAGASCEVNLPIGSGLKDDIAKRLNFKFEDGHTLTRGDEAIAQALRLAAKRDGLSAKDYFRRAKQISGAMPLSISIDSYVDLHAHDPALATCAKVAIVRAILGAEGVSLLMGRAEVAFSFTETGRSWLNRFFQLLTENVRVSEIQRRLASIALIAFNYDRCIEHFLYHAVQRQYSVTGDEAARLLKGLKVYHPYGSVGALPWQGDAPTAEFGESVQPSKLLELAGQIRTFTEGTDAESSEIVEIRGLMSNAPRLVFLGFAYHDLNLELLLPEAGIPPTHFTREILGTALTMSDSDQDYVANELFRRSRIPGGNILLRNDLTCARLLQDYSRKLASGWRQ